MPFELQIALRYLLAKRRQVFISVISLVSTLGVTVGVMALVIALAIMTGLQQELRDRILGAMAHVNVWKTGGITDYREEVVKLTALPGVVAAAPAVYGKAIISGTRRYVPDAQGHGPRVRAPRHRDCRGDDRRQPRGAQPAG